MRGTIRAVDGVDLNINEKETVGLVGESGCGKSTLALSIMRLTQKPGIIEDGKIKLRDKNLLELPEKEMRRIRGRDISMIFQDPMTYMNPVMKIEDQIVEVFFAGAHHKRSKLSKSDAEKKVIETLKSVQIASPEKVAEYYPHQLSGGMLQRVLISIAISHNPLLIVADEPTTCVDVTTQAQIFELFKQIQSRLDSSMLLITHDLGIVAGICDRVYVMYAGQIVEGADVFDLFSEPLHPYTSGLLKSVLSIDEFKENLETIEGSVPSLIDPPKGCRFHNRCPLVEGRCRKMPPPKYEMDGREVRCWKYAGEDV